MYLEKAPPIKFEIHRNELNKNLFFKSNSSKTAQKKEQRKGGG